MCANQTAPKLRVKYTSATFHTAIWTHACSTGLRVPIWTAFLRIHGALNFFLLLFKLAHLAFSMVPPSVPSFLDGAAASSLARDAAVVVLPCSLRRLRGLPSLSPLAFLCYFIPCCGTSRTILPCRASSSPAAGLPLQPPPLQHGQHPTGILPFARVHL
jgi:hypothetical protein